MQHKCGWRINLLFSFLRLLMHAWGFAAESHSEVYAVGFPL